MSATPAVSVVMATFNGAGLIGETLNSLAAQTFADFEVIVVDDCSTDDTRALVAAWPDPRVRLIALEQNGGPVRARNLAVAAARGRYIAALDHDDLCRPERFARQVAYLDSHPSTVVLGTAAAMLENGRIGPAGHAPVTMPLLVEWLLRIENPLVWSSVMIRTDSARRLDMFTRPDLLYAEDFDLYHRMARLGRIARLDDELVVYRHHAAGLSKRFTDLMCANAARVLAGAYAPLLGEGADNAAALVTRHLVHGEPPPDRATLARLGTIIMRLQRDFLATHAVDRDSRRLIRWETAKRWGRLTRSGLRSGSLGVADALAVRPDHLGLGYAGLHDLAWSRLVGGVRAVGRRQRGAA